MNGAAGRFDVNRQGVDEIQQVLALDRDAVARDAEQAVRRRELERQRCSYCLSSAGEKDWVELSCDVALEASERLFLREAFLGSAVDVLPRSRVVDHARHDDPPERCVGLAVTAAVEAVSFVFAA